MSSLDQQQKEYYARTDANYEQVHVSDADEHSLAIKFMIATMRLYDINTVLDVGSGTGRAVKALLDAGFEVRGIEPVDELIMQGEQRGIPASTIMQGYGQDLPFPDSSFDAVCQFGALHHVKEPGPVIKEMLRCSSKAVYLSDTNRYGRAGMFARLVKLFLFKTGIWKFAYYAWTRGKNCDISDCDGIAYSYSVYDSLDKINAWADRVIMIRTKVEGKKIASWLHPLLTSSHILLCAFKEKGIQ